MPQYVSEKALPENEWTVSTMGKDMELIVYYQRKTNTRKKYSKLQNFVFLLFLRQLFLTDNPKYFNAKEIKATQLRK